MTNPILRVDGRIGSKHLAGPLKKYEIPVKVSVLEYGDVTFEGNGPEGTVKIGVELKTIHDLIHSFLSGRLIGRQVPGMVRTYHARYLIIEGIWKLSEGGIEIMSGNRWRPPRSALTGMALNRLLTTLEQRAGFYVRRTHNQGETVQTINDLYRWWQKPWKKHEAHLAYDSKWVNCDRSLLEQPTWVEVVGKEFPHVGWKMAHRLPFRSVREMTNAPRSKWLRVKGLSNTKVDDIISAIVEEQ